MCHNTDCRICVPRLILIADFGTTASIMKSKLKGSLLILCCFCLTVCYMFSFHKGLYVPGFRTANQRSVTIIKVVNSRQFKSANCVKPANAESHIICDSLPFQTPSCRNNTKGSVPNIVHYVWIGNGTLKIYQYISILSVATNHKPDKMIFHINDVVPQGELWLNLVAQIPCLEIEKFKAPTQIYGNQIEELMAQSDVARFQILLKHGGIYLDSDVIVVASLDPLRQYPFTMGFNGLKSLSAGSFLSVRNATFLQELLNGYKQFNEIKEPVSYFSCIRSRDLALSRKDLPIHIEETSMQRPNVWIEHESIAESSHDLSDNYMIHIHPKFTTKYFSEDFLEWGIDEVRIHDSTYGAAARAALFGTRDLVFLRGEEEIAKDRKPRKPIKLISHDDVKEHPRNFLKDNLAEIKKASTLKNHVKTI